MRRTRQFVMLALIVGAAFLWKHLNPTPLEFKSAEPASEWVAFEGCRLIESAYLDGDSFHVDAPAGEGRQTFIVRLYGADCPETDARFPQRNAEQARAFGIAASEVPAWGRQAREFSRQFLSRPFTIHTRKRAARGQSKMPRFYAIVIGAGGRDLAESLVQDGLARVFGVFPQWPVNAAPDRYQRLLERKQTAARRNHAGVWASGAQTDPRSEMEIGVESGSSR